MSGALRAFRLRFTGRGIRLPLFIVVWASRGVYFYSISDASVSDALTKLIHTLPIPFQLSDDEDITIVLCFRWGTAELVIWT